MPIVRIYGVPTQLGSYAEELIRSIQLKLECIKELKITDKQVSVFFPADVVHEGRGEELIIYVDLLAKPEITTGVLDRVVNALLIACANFTSIAMPKCKSIKVFVTPFDATTGIFHHLKLK